MKLKTVEFDGTAYAVVVDGKPVFVHEDGKEIPFDAPSTMGNISRLNSEAAGHRRAKDEAEAKAKLFEGIEDPEAAKKALETVANLEAGKLLEAGKVEEIKRGVEAAAEARFQSIIAAKDTALEAVTTERDGLATALDREIIGGGFSRSKYLEEKLILPPDIAETYFGKHFKREDGQLVAYDSKGTKIFSREKPGEPASFDEALEVLVEAYPRRDHILKGEMNPGGGAQQPGSGGKNTMRQEDFDKLDAKTRAAKAAEPGFTLIPKPPA